VALAWLNVLNEKGLDPEIIINDKLGNHNLLTQIMDNNKIDLVQNGDNLTILLNDEDVSAQIRDILVTKYSSPISAYPVVREKLIDQQRVLGQNGGVVMDGRDIGTVVFPNADLKVFLIANLDARTERRHKELHQKGVKIDKDELKKQIAERDHNDSTRASSPLKKAADAIEMDTSNLSFEQQVEELLKLANNIINQ
jgi:cytidylate kinase